MTIANKKRAMLIHHHGACVAASKATKHRDWAFALLRFAALARGELRDLPGQIDLFQASKQPQAQLIRAQAAIKLGVNYDKPYRNKQ